MYKIDLHCHTVAVQGKDNKNRQLTSDHYDDFLANAKRNNVKIIAITNHNFIDFSQFKILECRAKKIGILMLLGIELDFNDDNGDRHAMNIIFGEDPDLVKNWYEEEIGMNSGVNYIAKHYSVILSNSTITKMKKILTIPTSLKQSNRGKNFSDQEVSKLIDLLDRKKDIHFYEISNINNPNNVFKKQNLPYIAGSDSHNVLSIDYSNISSLPIILKDFDSLKKFYDDTVEEEMKISLNFEAERQISDICKNNLSFFETKIKENIINIPIIKGVNLLFGSYASGKTTILQKFRDAYNSVFENKKIELFQNNETKDNFDAILQSKDDENFSKTIFDKMPKVNLNIILDFEQKNNEVLSGNYIRAAMNKIKEYVKGQRKERYRKITNLKSEKTGYLHFDDFNRNDAELDNKIETLNKINIDILSEFLQEILKENHDVDKDILTKFEDFKKLVIKKIKFKRKENFVNYIKSKIYKNIVEKIQYVVKSKTNAGSKVNDIGLFKQYEVKRNIKRELDKFNNVILPSSSETKIDTIENNSFYRKQIFKFDDAETVGIKVNSSQRKAFLLAFQTELKVEHVNKVIKFSKLVQKDLSSSKNLIKNLNKLNNYIIDKKLLQIQEIKNQNNVLNLKYFLRCENITINDSKEEVHISDGQKKIICLRNYLKVVKDVYLLDEPEASLDNSTIMNSIIKELQDLGKAGKIVIIATHNSNIAIYTKPLNLIYREVVNNEYNTFIGNFYDKNLLKIQLDDEGIAEIEIKDKSAVLLNIMEGGRNPFIERGNYYGTN